MTNAKLNIWVSEIEDPCKISQRQWYVNIYHCDGTPLVHCDRKYIVLPTKCGHLEIDVPPGCYRINAVWSYRLLGGIYYVNHYTDNAVVQACCGKDHCMTLFTPSAHRCGTIYLRAIRNLVRQEGGLKIEHEQLEQLEKIITSIDGNIPADIKRPALDLDDPDEIEKLVQEKEREFCK